MDKEVNKYNYIPMVGETRYLNQSDKAVKRCEKIIYDLFVVMASTLIYAVICQKWLFFIVFGSLVLIAYLGAQKEIKDIKKDLS